MTQTLTIENFDKTPTCKFEDNNYISDKKPIITKHFSVLEIYDCEVSK